MLLLNRALVNLAYFNLISYLFVKIDLFNETSVLYPFASSISTLKNRTICRTRRLRGCLQYFRFVCLSNHQRRKMNVFWFTLWVSLLTASALVKLGTESQHLWKHKLELRTILDTTRRGGSRQGWSDRIVRKKYSKLVLLNKGIIGRGGK